MTYTPQISGNNITSGKRITEIGTAVLTLGTVTVATVKATNTCIIELTHQPGGSNIGLVNVTAITNGVSFAITSINALDSGVVGYVIFEPN